MRLDSLKYLDAWLQSVMSADVAKPVFCYFSGGIRFLGERGEEGIRRGEARAGRAEAEGKKMGIERYLPDRAEIHTANENKIEYHGKKYQSSNE
eukprot:2573308-Pyramimonas_sp.AAC.1